MTNREIALKIISNVQVGSSKLEDLKKALKDYIDWASKANKDVFEIMPEEKVFLDVCAEMTDILLPNDKLAESLSSKMPFWLKPFIGIILPAVKIPFIAYLIKLVDARVLDHHCGPNWYVRLRDLAIKK